MVSQLEIVYVGKINAYKGIECLIEFWYEIGKGVFIDFLRQTLGRSSSYPGQVGLT